MWEELISNQQQLTLNLSVISLFDAMKEVVGLGKVQVGTLAHPMWPDEVSSPLVGLNAL